MWRFKLRHLLSSAPEYLTTVDRGSPPVRGKYLRLSSIDNTPCALGRVLYEAQDSFVYELIALREGYNALIVEICKHPPGSAQYEQWWRRVKEQSEAAEREGFSLLFERLPGGSTVKIMPYISRSPEIDWHTRRPAREIEAMIGREDLSGAAALCGRMLEEHGPKGLLLEEMARIRRRQGDLQEARHLFERSVKAHRQEGNPSILNALFELAVTLLDLYQSETSPNTIEFDLGDGITQRQTISPLDPQSPMPPTDLSDVALEVLIESLFVEPYFASALLLLCRMLGDGWESEAFRLVAKAFLAIDPFHPSAPEIQHRFRELSFSPEETGDEPEKTEDDEVEEGEDEPEETYGDKGEESEGEPEESEDDSEDGTGSGPKVPPHIAEMLRSIEAAYEPPIPDDVVSAESLLWASQYHAGRGDMKRAERDLRRALNLSPANATVVTALADLWCHDNKWEQAREWLLQQKKELAEDWQILEALGRISSQLGSHKDSCIYFHKALASKGEDSSGIKARLGNAYRHLGNEELGRAYLNEAYQESPQEPLASLFLLQLLKARMLRLSESEEPVSLSNELAEADRILKSADENGILTGDLLFIKAQMLMIVRNPQEALKVLHAVLARDPDHPQAAEAIHVVEEWLEPHQSDSAKEAGSSRFETPSSGK